jgi:hypothetical protein
MRTVIVSNNYPRIISKTGFTIEKKALITYKLIKRSRYDKRLDKTKDELICFSFGHSVLSLFLVCKTPVYGNNENSKMCEKVP